MKFWSPYFRKKRNFGFHQLYKKQRFSNTLTEEKMAVSQNRANIYGKNVQKDEEFE